MSEILHSGDIMSIILPYNDIMSIWNLRNVDRFLNEFVKKNVYMCSVFSESYDAIQMANISCMLRKHLVELRTVDKNVMIELRIPTHHDEEWWIEQYKEHISPDFKKIGIKSYLVEINREKYDRLKHFHMCDIFPDIRTSFLWAFDNDHIDLAIIYMKLFDSFLQRILVSYMVMKNRANAQVIYEFFLNDYTERIRNMCHCVGSSLGPSAQRF
jgi:hypothetical protein